MRVIWALEELRLSYELITKEREELQKPDFLAINPLGKVPVLIDGDLTIIESGAILEYLLARYGKGRLAPNVNDQTYPQYLQWFHFAESSLMPLVSQYIRASGLFFGTPPDEQGMKAALDAVKPFADLIEDTLSAHPYISGGELTAADLMMGWVLIIARRFEMLGDYKNIVAYVQRLSEHPGCQKAMKGLL